MTPLRLVALLAIALTGCSGNRTTATPRKPSLADVGAWAIQLQGLERPGAVERLARADVDLVILDPVSTVTGRESYPMSAVVAQLHARPGRTLERKLVLAYVNVGQAESYRTYWGSDWTPPAAGQPGEPSFLVGADPDGWAENFTVRYWDPAWRSLLLDGPDSLVERVLADGFDGLFLDWTAGWSDRDVAAAAEREGVDPTEAMERLLCALAARVRQGGNLMVGNGSASLIVRRATVARCLDGIVQESVVFAGKAGVGWDDASAADVAVPAEGDWSTAATLAELARCSELGVRILTLDYASQTENARRARELATSNGFVPFVSRTPLDRLPPDVRLQN